MIKIMSRLRIDRFLLNSIGGMELCPLKLRNIIYNSLGNKICNAKIFSRCYIGGKGLSVGDKTFINHECFFDLSDTITIEDNCNIGMRCIFVTGTHNIGGSSRRATGNITKSIYIGEGSWIGANVTILPGVKVGKGCIVAAGATVVDDCEANCVYAGVPAHKIRTLAD